MSWNTFTPEDWDNFTPEDWFNFIVDNSSVDWFTFTADKWNNFTADDWNNFFADSPFGGECPGTHDVFNAFNANAVLTGGYSIFNLIANNEASGLYLVATACDGGQAPGTYNTLNLLADNKAQGLYAVTVSFDNNVALGAYESFSNFANNQAPGEYGIAETFQGNQAPGNYAVAMAVENNAAPGNYGITVAFDNNEAPGQYIVTVGLNNNQAPGSYGIAETFANNQAPGQFGIVEIFPNNQAPGNYGVTLGFINNQAPGNYGITLGFVNNQAPGAYGVSEAFINNSAPGAYGVTAAFGGQAPGFHRIANDDLELFELYRGIGAEPDYDATPFDTSQFLPFTTPVLSFPSDNFFTLRKRNQFNLVSQNITSFRLNLDASGDVIAEPPSPPLEIDIQPGAGGAVFVSASYFYLLDKALQGNQFLVFIRSDGTDPDPLIDTPDIVNMIKSDGVAELGFTSPTFADGLTIKALVQVRRTDPGPILVDSVNLTPVTTTSNINGPAQPFPSAIFFGAAASQGGIGG